MRFKLLSATRFKGPVWRVESGLGGVDIACKGLDYIWTWFDDSRWRLTNATIGVATGLMRNKQVCAEARLLGGWNILSSPSPSVRAIRRAYHGIRRLRFTDQVGGIVAHAVYAGRPVRCLPFLRHNDFLVICRPSLACFALAALIYTEESRTTGTNSA